jgi:hypothetical protein
MYMIIILYHHHIYQSIYNKDDGYDKDDNDDSYLYFIWHNIII